MPENIAFTTSRRPDRLETRLHMYVLSFFSIKCKSQILRRRFDIQQSDIAPENIDSLMTDEADFVLKRG